MSAPMLRVQALVHQYAGAPMRSLDGVDLQVERGSVLGLLGPNGAGKTTLISHLGGQIAVQQGAIEIDGVPLEQVRASAPTRIAVAPQEHAFYPMLTVAENIACFGAAARLKGSRLRERSAACIALAQLERFRDVRAERLSGGLKRRLNLAIALLAEPELIVFDEPTAGVDPQSRAFIIDAIRALARAGAAVIYTTHYMEEIEACADQVVILDQGHVLCAGSLSALLATGASSLNLVVDNPAKVDLLSLLARHGRVDHDPQHRPESYHVNFAAAGEAGSSADADVTAAGSAATPAEVARQAGRDVVAGRAALAALADIAALAPTGLTLHHADFGHANLEHLFMALTRRSLRD
jgi:ABC-2 type transport system ATP-binding protein